MSIKHHSYKHGKTNSRTYKVWNQMKQRCANPKCKGHKNYGGRGITVCERWMDFTKNHVYAISFVACVPASPGDDVWSER